MGTILARLVTPPAQLDDPAPAEQELPRRRHLRDYDSYEDILNPEIHQAMYGAYLWDSIAVDADTEYNFVGRFAAALNGDNFLVKEIEVLVASSFLANHERKLNDIIDRGENYKYLTYTSGGQLIIVIHGNLGIAIRFVETGSVDYPETFVPPRDSHFWTPVHHGLPATYQRQLLPYPPCNASIPVLKFHLLLRQRLFQFERNENSTDQFIVRQNRRDIDDVVTFLRCSVADHDPPFPEATATRLLPIVRRWIRYARSVGIPTTYRELQFWRALGIALTDADIAGLGYY